VTTTSEGLLVAPGEESAEGTFVSNNPRVNISYKTSADGLVYANVAKGFRSGGFNLGLANAPPTYGPETLWTYTLGTKQEWLERRLGADLSVYYNNWTHMQTTGYSNGTPLNYVTNSGRASGPGVNFALNANPISDLTASATLGYADMKHDDKSAVTNPGDPVDLVEKWTYSATVDYHRPLADGIKLISRIDYGYGRGYQITVRNTPPGIFTTPSRAVLDARLGVDLGRYQVYAYGHNLTDNNGQLFPGPLGTNPEPVLPTPRTIGLGGRVTF
jgi:iron complex outermembrane receptor protein